MYCIDANINPGRQKCWNVIYYSKSRSDFDYKYTIVTPDALMLSCSSSLLLCILHASILQTVNEYRHLPVIIRYSNHFDYCVPTITTSVLSLSLWAVIVFIKCELTNARLFIEISMSRPYHRENIDLIAIAALHGPQVTCWQKYCISSLAMIVNYRQKPIMNDLHGSGSAMASEKY